MMDALENAVAQSAAPPTTLLERERFAPWWGWFGLIIILALIGYGAILHLKG